MTYRIKLLSCFINLLSIYNYPVRDPYFIRVALDVYQSNLLVVEEPLFESVSY